MKKTITKRKDNFRSDPKVKTGSAALSDYKGSGYDRGHLAPAADFKWSATAMSESFYMSNMSPQVPGFNRGIWKNIESTVRNWAVENDEIYIVTGPVLILH
jgi:endonuclease G